MLSLSFQVVLGSVRVYWQNNVVKLAKIHDCDLLPKQCFDFDKRKKKSIKYSRLEWFIHAALVFVSHELLPFKTAINKTFSMIPVNQQLYKLYRIEDHTNHILKSMQS